MLLFRHCDQLEQYFFLRSRWFWVGAVIEYFIWFLLSPFPIINNRITPICCIRPICLVKAWNSENLKEQIQRLPGSDMRTPLCCFSFVSYFQTPRGDDRPVSAYMRCQSLPIRLSGRLLPIWSCILPISTEICGHAWQIIPRRKQYIAIRVILLWGGEFDRRPSFISKLRTSYKEQSSHGGDFLGPLIHFAACRHYSHLITYLRSCNSVTLNYDLFRTKFTPVSSHLKLPLKLFPPRSPTKRWSCTTGKIEK